MRTAFHAVSLSMIVLSGLFNVEAAAQAPEFLPPQQVGTVEHAAIDEASGMAASRANPDVLWVHNDSGDTARVFAMNVEGVHLGIYRLVGVSATDWEDMAVGPGPVADQSYLFLGDIGDNAAVRPTIRVYRVPEPAVSASQPPVDVDLPGVATITLQYPDGPRDAETLMIDPATRDLYIISKRESRSRIYRAPYPQSTSQTVILEYHGQLPWGGATGGDISPTGGEILVRQYSEASLWRRPAGTTVWEALAQPGYSVPLAVEPQGESISFDRTGSDYYTVSEGTSQPIYYYERVPLPGDIDGDYDVDIDDFVFLVNCLAGPETAPAPDCEPADLGRDGDADLGDVAEFQRLFTASQGT